MIGNIDLKALLYAIVTLVVISSVICLFVYINKLNSKITDLNVTIENQNNQIESLQQNIVVLKNNVSALKATMTVTDNYISIVEKTHTDEMTVKQAIYEEVISDPQTKTWFDEKLPSNIVDMLSNVHNDGMCKDSN